MSEDQNPLDAPIESLLRSNALWEEPSTGVADSIFSQIQEPASSNRFLAWAIGIAAATALFVVGFIALTPDPDWSVAVAAAPESGIWGEVSGFNEPTGTRVVLEIHNLEPADAGTFYEVWWVQDGAAVSSGSFLKQDTIEMWMGVRRSEFPKMLLTIEPADGDPARSGDVIAWSED